jgi:hypothetical protein
MPFNPVDGPPRFVPPPPTPLMTQAAALLLGGVAVTSIETPTLNGTYACDLATWSALSQTLQYTQANGVFPIGITTLVRTDKNGAPHSFATVASFQAFATAIGAYTAALVAIAAGAVAALPNPDVSIP